MESSDVVGLFAKREVVAMRQAHHLHMHRKMENEVLVSRPDIIIFLSVILEKMAAEWIQLLMMIFLFLSVLQIISYYM